MEFKDRVSAYPNRYLLTDENGNTSYVHIERADEPTVPGTPLDAETLNNLLQKEGGVMTGSIEMGGHSLSGLPEPSTDNEAATKAYVDGKAGMELLWENEYPGNAFPAQLVEINTDSYSMAAIEFMESTTASIYITDICFTAKVGGAAVLKYRSVDGTILAIRYASLKENGVRFDNSRKYNNGTQETDGNLSVIPLRIWGVK